MELDLEVGVFPATSRVIGMCGAIADESNIPDAEPCTDFGHNQLENSLQMSIPARIEGANDPEARRPCLERLR